MKKLFHAVKLIIMYEKNVKFLDYNYITYINQLQYTERGNL